MPKSNLAKSILTLIILLSLMACTETKEKIDYPTTDLRLAALIPKPVKVVPTNTAFGLDSKTVIFTSQNGDGFEEVGRFLANKIKSSLELEIPVNKTNAATVERIIYINQADDLESDSPEAYELYIKPDSVLLSARTAAGAFRGIQTLRQLIPEQPNDTLAEQPMWLIPSGKITDAPNFAYRGAMLDVARHFFSVEEVKKYIDLLAYYKYNVLHLHLTDDQGWRIEIKKWPKLTEVGGRTEVGGGPGGFYTQEEFKDLVRYAAQRHIMIIPEIDMPGHTNAASVSYPFLNGNGKTPEPYTGTEVGFSTFDTRNDTVYDFVNDVIQEIAVISPSPYFHIGGDESHVTQKEDYRYFVEQVEKIVQKHGKRMMGWDEVINTNVSPETVVQHWRFQKDAETAHAKGNKIVLSPGHKMYLDMKYDSLTPLGLTWAGYIPVDEGYDWNPETYLENVPKESVLGIEAPLWSETIGNTDELEQLAFPRAIGYAELGWSLPEHMDWDDYRKRLAAQLPFLQHNKVNFYPSKLIDWKK